MLEGDKCFTTAAPQRGEGGREERGREREGGRGGGREREEEGERERERERQCKKDMEWYSEKFKFLKWVNSAEFTGKLIFEQKHGRH